MAHAWALVFWLPLIDYINASRVQEQNVISAIDAIAQLNLTRGTRADDDAAANFNLTRATDADDDATLKSKHASANNVEDGSRSPPVRGLGGGFGGSRYKTTGKSHPRSTQYMVDPNSIQFRFNYLWTDRGVQWLNNQGWFRHYGSPEAGSQVLPAYVHQLANQANANAGYSMLHGLLHGEIKVIPPVHLDDPKWKDDRYGNGKTTCRNLKPGECTRHGDYSIEAQQACPLACGVCKDDAEWKDDVHGNGTTTCRNLKPGECTLHGDYSSEAQRACPRACGVCDERDYFGVVHPFFRSSVEVANTKEPATFTAVPLFVWQFAEPYKSRSPLLEKINAAGGFSGLHYHNEETTPEDAGIPQLERLGKVLLLSTASSKRFIYQLYPEDWLSKSGHTENYQLMFEADIALFPAAIPESPLDDDLAKGSWVQGLWGYKLRFSDVEYKAVMAALPKVAALNLKFDENDINEDVFLGVEDIPSVYQFLLEPGTNLVKKNPITDEPYRRWDIIHTRKPKEGDMHYEVIFGLL